MSFITRCPACHTAFKVVSDQLKISEGWVRCGHCQQIFDATLDLQPWWPGVESVVPVPSPQPPVPSNEGGQAASAAEVPSTWSSPPYETPPAPFSSLPPAADADRFEHPHFRAAAEAAEAPEVAALSEPTESGQPAEPPAVPDAPDVPGASEHADELPTEPASALEPESEPPLTAGEPPPMPSFVRQAERRAVWRRPGVRWGLAVLVVLLTGVLGVQAALHWRDPIAAHAPQAQPALETLCAPLDCAVAPPRQLDDIVIDSSVLLRRAPGQYTFNVVVRNTAAVALAAPALELTLTDLQDQVVVRRVLLPHEWPEPRETLAPGAEWPVQFELELDTPQAQVMTGYRALLFYP